MYIITLKFNSTLGTIGKATGIKIKAKVVGKNSSSHFSVKKLNLWSCSKAGQPNFCFLVLNRFLCLSLNKNFIVIELPFVWSLVFGILGLKANSNLCTGFLHIYFMATSRRFVYFVICFVQIFFVVVISYYKTIKKRNNKWPVI